MTNAEVSKSPGYRGMLALVIILGILIVLGVIGLIVGVLMGAGSGRRVPEAYLAEIAAPGQHVESAQLDGARILVRLSGGAGGDELVVLDAGSGRTLGRIAVKAAP
jgi:hypothetical protein